MAGENDGDGGVRELLKYIREDMSSNFAALNARLDGFATRQMLNDAVKRLDEKIADLGSDVQDEKRERVTAFAELQTKQKEDRARTQQVADEQDRRRAAWKQGLILAGVGALLSGLVAVAVLLFQSVSHLG